MRRLFNELVKLPMSAFVRTMEVFVKALKDFQSISDQSIDAIVGLAVADRWNAGALSTGAATFTSSTNPQEVRRMVDQDLSGDDLKYVSYTILFTKRDLEATFEEEQQDIVSYSTDGGSYGALKIAKFMKKVGRGEIKRPSTWKENNYPPDAVDETHWEIPDEDEKYISFIYRVDRHLPRQEAEYDKDQVKVLREIRDRL
jgi:hypothetical protein